MDAKFHVLRKIENRPFIYDSRDPNHSKRDILSAAWEEIAMDVRINGKEVTGMPTGIKNDTIYKIHLK
jgi:hypothetical protein